jgi:hypothetical protein
MLSMVRFFLLLWCIALQAIDFDYVVVGTSPISIFEALYKRGEGYRVLVVEQERVCGGAWKSLSVCGVPHVDLGCHEFGKDVKVKKFLEVYAGCKMVSTLESGEFYPAGGCFELISNLETLIQQSGVVLWLGHKLESVFLDTALGIAEVMISGMRYTTRKLLLSTNSDIQLENPQSHGMHSPRVQLYPHLYLLLETESPPQFNYRNLGINGLSRAMNLTPFAGLTGSGKQLIALQVYNEECLDMGDHYLEELKKEGLVGRDAQVVCQESHTYKQVMFNRNLFHPLGESANQVVEFIDTGHINHISSHIDRWKRVLRPWGQ